VRRLVRALSRGAIAPALPLPMATFGQNGSVPPAPIRRVVILERPKSRGSFRTAPASTAEAVDQALRLLWEQREHISSFGGDAWRKALIPLERHEEQLLATAFEHASIERVTAPFPLSGDAISQFGSAVGLG
jgi:hypothetical protein